MRKGFAWVGRSISVMMLALGIVGVEDERGDALVHRNSKIPMSQSVINPAHQTAQRIPIVVYGRPGCSLTIEVRNGLHYNNIPYEFKDINNESIRQEMFDWIRAANINTSRQIILPVVTINNSKVIVSPDVKDVITNYRNSIPKSPLVLPPQVDNTFYGIFKRTGGFKIKNLERSALASEHKPLLSLAIRKTLAKAGSSYKGQNYSFFELDVNSDNRKDAFVILHGEKGVSGNGKNIWLYEALDSGNYRLVEVFQDKVALLPYDRTTLDWKRILQVPGSIISLTNKTQYQDCSVGTQRGSYAGNGIFRSLHFYRFCNTVTNEKFKISGTLIEIPPNDKILQDEIFPVDDRSSER